ncbi:chorismate-binding protein [Labilibaculum sp.]|uniref:chorismate-binding protein n=1 Tax=Labilibaculum sp. TaxID=2060723 RepID=UPI00356B2133
MVENRNELAAFFTYCLQNSFPFFAYQLPNSGIIQIGVQTDSNLKAYGCLSELEGENGFVFSPFDTESRHHSWFVRGDLQWEASEIDSQAIKALELHTNKADLELTDQNLLESSYNLYFNQVTAMISDLKQEKLDKTVLSRIQILEGMGKNQAAESFLKLSEAYQSAFVSFVSIPSVGNWIGASPETLLSSNENCIETVALAGTQKLGDRALDQISWEKKEREEQAFVSSYIDGVLASHHLSGYKRTGPVTAQAGNVVHLRTSYQLPADLNFSQLSALVQDLHPTPAVCGLPKQKAVQLIREIEKHDREYYAGYLGPIEASGIFSLFVNLRSMKVLENQMALFVGGGITADSIPENEWEETCLKAQTLLNVIRS